MTGDRFLSLPQKSVSKKETNKWPGWRKQRSLRRRGGVEKGFFRTIADTVNPFSSSDDETDKNKADGKKENGKEEDGFFSGLWPFGADKKEKGKILEQDNGQLVNSVDESLKEQGVLKTKYSESGKQNPQGKGQNSKSEIENLDIRAPAPNLPQVTLESPSADPKKVLADIDKGLDKGGKELADLPPPPEASSKLFVSRPSAPKKKQANDQNGRTISPTTTGLLGSIDEGLKAKGIEAPKADENARTLGGLEASQPSSIPASQPYVEEKIELTPRVSEENTPLFDAGDFQAKGRLKEEEKKVKPTPDKPADSPEGLPASLVKGPPPFPSEEKPAETTSADKKSGDKEKGALDQVTEDLKSLSDIFNPFGW